MRQLIAFGVVVAALTCCGCDAKSKNAITQECLRYGYVEDIGPMVVASIVGASASPSGPAGLNCLCTDQTWRMWMRAKAPEFEHVPSMFEAPDPNRRVKITNISRSNEIGNRSDP